jgi:serine/threonine protein kinase
MITFACSACQKKLAVKDDLAGKKAKCPACGRVTAVPAGVAVGPGGEEQTSPAPRSDPGQQSQATLPSPGKPDGTDGGTAPARDHGRSLIDFLAPPQAGDELGRLGKYRILQVLGHGGMGVVYLAEDTRLKRRVALKAMLPALAASPSAAQRFQREAEAMAAVEHDHIVRIYQVDEDRGVPFLAMEFLKGEPLDERLKREPGLPVAEVLRIGREIAEGLAAAHDTGLIHRDIKPGNVWLEAPPAAKAALGGPVPGGSPGGALVGRVKILDFGLARAAADSAHLTQPGVLVGTPAYMAPEQARGEVIDARCDLFSLGAVLYRMCTGRMPFKGKDPTSILLALASQQPPPVRELNPQTPPALAELIMQLLAKEPGRRPASARAVAGSLQTLEQNLTGPPTRSPQVWDQRTQAQEEILTVEAAPPRARRTAWWLVAAAVLAAGVVLGTVALFLVPAGQGTLEIRAEVAVPVLVERDGTPVAILDPRTRPEVSLPPGSYRLKVGDGGMEVTLDPSQITLGRGDRKIVTLRRPAVAVVGPAVNKRPPVVRVQPAYFDFYTKAVEYEGLSVVAHDAVKDEALWAARDRLEQMLGRNPGLVRNLKTRGAQFRVLGRDQLLARLPAQFAWNNLTRGEFPNERGEPRGVGGLFPCCPEENLLQLPGDRYAGRDLCVQVFAQAVLAYGLPPALRRLVNDQYRRSLARGLWQGAAAAGSDEAFFAELSAWYFGSAGDTAGLAPKPDRGPDGLRRYDPEAFELLDGIYSGRTAVAPFPLKDLPAQAPPRPGELSSAQGATTPTTITFVNEGAEEVRVYWIDREGKRELYGPLPAGKLWLLVTFLDHPWVVVDARGRDLALFWPQPEPGQAVIRAKP